MVLFRSLNSDMKSPVGDILVLHRYSGYLLAVKLPIDVRIFGIGDLAVDLGDDIAVFEPSHMSVTENNVPAGTVPSGKAVAPVVGAAEIRWTSAVIGSFAACTRCSEKATKAEGCAASVTLNGVSGTLLGAEDYS